MHINPELKRRAKIAISKLKAPTTIALLTVMSFTNPLKANTHDSDNEYLNVVNSEMTADAAFLSIKKHCVELDNTAKTVFDITGSADLSDYNFSSEELLDMKSGDKGKKLALEGLKFAKKYNNEYQCFAAVKGALRKTGLADLDGISAYMAAEQLNQNDNFVKINCDINDIDNLPNGAIVVYSKGQTKHGHIDIIVNKKAASSKIRDVNKGCYKWGRDKKGNKVKQYYGGIDVFIPADTKLADKSVEMCCAKILDKKFAGLWDKAVANDGKSLKMMEKISSLHNILDSKKSITIAKAMEGISLPTKIHLQGIKSKMR